MSLFQTKRRRSRGWSACDHADDKQSRHPAGCVVTINAAPVRGAPHDLLILADQRSTSSMVSETHSRSVSLELAWHLVARGQVTVTDGFSACQQGVPVKIQRMVSARWETVDTSNERQHRLIPHADPRPRG